MANKTPLYQCHLDAGAKLVDFAGSPRYQHSGKSPKTIAGLHLLETAVILAYNTLL